jgi:hypothetical protein
VELTREVDENFVSAYPGVGLAAALLAAGDPARAVGVRVGSAGGEELPLIPRSWRAHALERSRRTHASRSRAPWNAPSAQSALQ